MQKRAGMLVETGKAFVDPSAMIYANERGLRFLEFATFNDLVLVNTFGSSQSIQKMEMA